MQIPISVIGGQSITGAPFGERRQSLIPTSTRQGHFSLQEFPGLESGTSHDELGLGVLCARSTALKGKHEEIGLVRFRSRGNLQS